MQEYLRENDYYNIRTNSYFTSVKKHFIKMLKDVGMVVPKRKETRL